MPTFVTHAVVGLAAGGVIARRGVPARFWILTAVSPTLADLDVAAFAMGIPYEHFLGHRGFFHSLLFALVLGALISLFFLRRDFRFVPSGWLILYFCLLCASHPLLDAFTNGGLGIALFSPIDNSRIFFPWRPIQVSPIGLRGFLSASGMRTLLSEMLWVWIPTAVLALACWLVRKSIQRRGSMCSPGMQRRNGSS